MENQHRKISGYRELTQVEIDLMNKIKALGPAIHDVMIEVGEHVGAQYSTCDPDDILRLTNAEPYRWLALAQDHIQQGLMALTRSVAQPEFF